MTALPGLEGVTIARLVYTTLTNDVTVQNLLGGATDARTRVTEGVYAGPANLWVTFTVLPDFQDVKGVGLEHIMTRVQFQVRVTGKGTSYTPLVPLYQRAHELLESKTRTQEVAQGGQVLTAERVSGFQFPERVNGIEYRHLGGTYEALTQ